MQKFYQYGGAQVEFVEELSDKDMDFQNPLRIVCFHLLQHLHKPLEVLVGGTNPQKVDLNFFLF